MILVLDDEVQADYRYLGPEIAHFLPESEYQIYVDDTDIPRLDSYAGVVISGSTASVYENDYPWLDNQLQLIEACIERQIPLLGICFGHQIINYALGGEVKKDRRRATFVEITNQSNDDRILESLNPIVPVLHSDLVTEPGENMQSTATTEYSDFFCTRHFEAPVWTVQFHPEFTERVKNQPSDWSAGSYSFDECNATRVLENFATVCRKDSIADRH
jgi:GMP synthase (glutamine-hydrolysing)